MTFQIFLYQQKYFNQLCQVMDKGRMQELKNENLEAVFVSLRNAPYLDYFLSCRIYIAVERQKLVGFVGAKPHHLEFLYVDPDKQGQGIGTVSMKRVLLDLNRPVQLDVFTHNLKAKRLYQKFGFQVIDSVTEKWSDAYPVDFSQDKMKLN